MFSFQQIPTNCFVFHVKVFNISSYKKFKHVHCQRWKQTKSLGARPQTNSSVTLVGVKAFCFLVAAKVFGLGKLFSTRSVLIEKVIISINEPVKGRIEFSSLAKKVLRYFPGHSSRRFGRAHETSKTYGRLCRSWAFHLS